METVCNRGHMIVFFEIWDNENESKKEIRENTTSLYRVIACLLCKVFERCFNYEEYLLFWRYECLFQTKERLMVIGHKVLGQ